MRPITTDGALIAAASSAHRGPTTLPPTSPRSGSSAGPSSAASSTNTSGPHRSPGQDRWPSSETPHARRDHHERVRRYRVGPCCWEREQLPVLVVEVDPVLTPVLAVGDELEVLAAQGMERVRHPDASVPIMRIGCS